MLSGKKDGLCPLLCIYFYPYASILCPDYVYIDRPLPQNYITWDLLLAGISSVSTNRRHSQEKKSKIHLSDTNFCFSSRPPNPWFWQWLCSSTRVHYYWAAHLPPLQLSLGSDTINSYSYPIRHWSSNGFPLLWALECFTIPFRHLFILPTSP